MPNNKSFNYMVATTCSEKTVEAYGISIVHELQQWGRESVGNERQYNFMSMQREYNCHKILALTYK